MPINQQVLLEAESDQDCGLLFEKAFNQYRHLPQFPFSGYEIVAMERPAGNVQGILWIYEYFDCLG